MMRAELFSVGQLEHHAKKLASWYRLAPPGTRRPDALLPRLAANELAFQRAYELVTQAASRGRRITPAAEWFIDNFPLIEEQIRTARRHLPRGYSRELPQLANRSLAGTPRVYHLAIEIISHSHGRIDEEGLAAFVAAFQGVTPLLLGELWAIPIMLRLALLENLRRIVGGVVAGLQERERAAFWITRMADVAVDRREDVVLVLADLVKESPALTHPFVSELASRLQGQGPALAIASSWLDQRLSERGETVAQVFQLANQSQAADQVSIGNSIGALRFLGTTDWRRFVEGVSVVHATLCTDPSGTYPSMDFETRDRYRHAVEALARRSALGENDVAAAAIALAATARDPGSAQAHVGAYLVDTGRAALEAAIEARRSVVRSGRRFLGRHPLVLYLGAIAALSAAATAGMTSVLLPTGGAPGWLGALIIALSLVATSQLATALVQCLVTARVTPRLLPRLDFSKGIPREHATLVAVPALLTQPAEIDALVDALELRFLANRDQHLSFSLLTDFKDAATERCEGDDALLAHASAAIERLEERYRGDGDRRTFFLFHRARRWNPRERLWMGWERKRGKLEDLNAALRGARDRFATIVGDATALAAVRYVIVLDSDTQLPRDAGRTLVATMAHPLNRPVYDEVRGRVTRGYSILQPRVGVSMASAGHTRFSQLFAGEPGIDPYTRAVSDVYQDLFGEGSFIGKGIYHVDMLQRALAGRIPENRVLSHDLLEGAYARSGLVGDVLLVEEHPASHRVDMSRRSRWIRGDWQIASWASPRVPVGAAAPRGPRWNPLSALSRWKIFDNLRRSTVAPALLALLALGWSDAGIAVFSTLFVTAVIFLPGSFNALSALARRPNDVSRRLHASDVARELLRQLVRDALALAWLPADAVLSVVAIARALVRTWLTRRRMLEWRTASDAAGAARVGALGCYRALWATVAMAVVGTGLLVLLNPAAWTVAVPLVLLWAVAPALSWWLSAPLHAPRQALAPADQLFLRKVARRTWRYFSTFAAGEDSELAPDNFQEEPPLGIAHRTSPTNIGVGLLSNLAAFDFGFIGTSELVDRTARALATLDRMERHRGHFYNWYDTRTLEPMRPRYVSTVDSGNLAGHLLTLAAGLDEIDQRALIDRPQLRSGITDTLACYEDACAEAGLESAASDAVLALRALLATPTPTPTDSLALWQRAAELAVQLPRGDDEKAEPALWVAELMAHVESALVDGRLTASSDSGDPFAERLAALRGLAERCRAFAETDVEFLYDRSRRLLAIGAHVVEDRPDRLDTSFYDLLASEARLASFLAIAHGKLPQEHWFSLGRTLTTSGGKPALLSWSGSMFEYLMPLLVMPTYQHTLLDDTYRGIVQRQIDYMRTHDVPWGISESGYSKTDAQQHYQYRAFGVPGLGYKRGLAEDLVVAPYASAMALLVAPVAACANLRRLERDGRLGRFGFYEAIDYTPARLPPGKTSVPVRSFMAHHQGMTLLSLAYALLDRPMQRRFLAEPAHRATELLLQERVPKTPPITPHPADVSAGPAAPDAAAGFRIFATPHTPRPEVHLLSNGQYHVAVTNAGGGYSRWRDLAVTRWREDPTRDCWGTFLYLRDTETGAFWSAAHQPTLVRATSYEAIFSQGRAELRRVDGDIESQVEISVSPEDDIELRRVTVTNRGRAARTLELTSYAEVVLAPPAADTSHPAFSNLFVQTELLRDAHAILCTRRPRSGGETPPTLAHVMSVPSVVAGATSYETAREAFIGRGRSVADPIAMHSPSLTNSEGAVLDPIVSVRSSFVVEPQQTVQLHVVTGVAETRDLALALVEKYRDRHLAARVLELSWTHCQVALRRLDATDADVQHYERLASHVLYSNPSMRAPESVVVRNQRSQRGLWGYGISGDLPIVLVRIGDINAIALVAQILKAQAYWRLKGLVADVVIWNEDPSGYRQVLQEQITALVASVGGAALLDRPGGVFVRRGEQMSEDDKLLIQSVARVIVNDTAGTLAEQMERLPASVPGHALPGKLVRAPEPRVPDDSVVPSELPAAAPQAAGRDLAQHNGLGGFTRDGREYVITTTDAARTPAPWVNVIANPWFGTVISESGAAYTWCENAHGNRLTPWNNDPVCDVSGEACYLRDEESGRFWSPTPLPASDDRPTTTRHGFGYTVFEHENDGIASELRTFVATDAPIKFVLLKLRNSSGRTRRLSLTGTFELVLGAARAANLPHIVTEVDPKTGALLASNPFNAEFAQRVAFLDASEEVRSVSGDRTEVLGRNGSTARPACMTRMRLSGRVGGRLDPCLAMQVGVEIEDGQEREVVFTFGSGRDRGDALHLIRRFRGVRAAHDALAQVWGYWNHALGAVHVQTPDETLNFLGNGWLLYQVLASRMWARSGFYQSGGAFGFRDQLQDSMALVHAEPALSREQLVRSAARQFLDGDVQHWWHPPEGRGVRTRISDDYLWLPYATCRYLTAVGDRGVLDERVPFLAGRSVKADEDSYYDLPAVAEEGATLYDHCVRAIGNGLRTGAHGLPLMGCGDWNDGMNLVGHQGRGESVWLGFFLHEVLARFEPVARQRGDTVFADLCASQAAELRARLEEHGWDGAWYRRAYFDDGTPLGSSANTECQIDALPQSWAVLSGVGDPERARHALAAVDVRLVRRDLGIIQLFDPPFDGAGPEPGYVRGYVPGVRENGGQYTHAAVWTVMAFAEAGDVERAWELFRLINPVRHGGTAAAIARYQVEPYVVAADVYANEQHAGRGGWTWYTGAAGWMYRLVIESLLGIHLEIDRLRISPKLPAAWPSMDVHYRHRDTVHHIHVRNRGGTQTVTRVVSDGVEQGDRCIPLHADRNEHWAEVDVGEG
ncbi:MAG: cyclic beta 1-2 glucan synthetase [Deltaproteobacteria bacterium RBG_16_71_12]|nr:MAG: cyclic beta 1-2 glucan synthetase [Deltaproteobacteria bacterium RBG_16_71_12]